MERIENDWQFRTKTTTVDFFDKAYPVWFQPFRNFFVFFQIYYQGTKSKIDLTKFSFFFLFVENHLLQRGGGASNKIICTEIKVDGAMCEYSKNFV